MVVRLKQLAQESATSGQAILWDSSSSKWLPGDVRSLPLYTLSGNGVIGTATKVDAAVAVSAFTITGIKAYRGTAGTSGSTIVDVNQNGTTLFTTQANRPTFAYTDGDDYIVTKLPDVVAISTGDLLTFDVDQVEGGSPADLVIEVYGVSSSLTVPSSYDEKDSNEIGEWLPASSNNVTIDTEGRYDLTDKVLYKRCTGNAASQQGGFATGFIVPAGVSSIANVYVEYKASTTSMNLDLTVVDTGGTEYNATQWSPVGTTKEIHSFNPSAGTYTAGQTVYILFKCSLDSAELVSLAKIKVTWSEDPTSESYSQKDSHEVGDWVPASANDVNIDSEGLYDLTDKVLYKRCIGNQASQQGGFAAGFGVPVGATSVSSIVVEYKASTTSLTIQIDMIDTAGGVQAESGFAPSTTNKESHTYSSPGGTVDAGGTIFVLVKCSVDSAETVSLSKITVNWS